MLGIFYDALNLKLRSSGVLHENDMPRQEKTARYPLYTQRWMTSRDSEQVLSHFFQASNKNP